MRVIGTETIGVTMPEITYVDAAQLGILPGSGDQTAAINQALTNLSAGQVLVLSAGDYNLTGTLLLSSGTGIAGAGATLHADVGNWIPPAVDDPSVNSGYALVSNRNYASDTIADHDMSVIGLSFDYGAWDPGGSHAVRFRSAADVTVSACSFNGGNDGTAMIGCNGTLVQNCQATNTTNAAFDHWEGTSNATVTGCTARVAGGSGVLFTAAGTHGEALNATNVAATNNRISGTFGVEGAGILIDTLSAGSSVSTVLVSGNTVDGQASAGNGIGVLGDVAQATVTNNTIRGVQGLAVFSLTDASGQPSTFAGSGNTVEDAQAAAADAAFSTEDTAAAAPIWLAGLDANVTVSGNDVVVVEATSATIRAASWVDPNASTRDDLTVLAGAGRMQFFNGNGMSTVAGGTGSMSIDGGMGGGLFVGGSDGDNLIVSGQSATSIMGGGSGDRLVAVGSGAHLIKASDGNTTLDGGGSSGNDVLIGGAGNDVIRAGSGNVTVVGGTGRTDIAAGSGIDLIQCGEGGGTVTMSTGQATLAGGGGAQATYLFDAAQGGGSDLIVGFRLGVDHLSLRNYAAGEATSALARGESGGGSSRIVLSDGTTVTLAGVGSLSSSLFA